MKNIFTNHPYSVGETYIKHLKFAFRAGSTMIIAGTVSIIHACFPFIFEHTASNMIISLANKLSNRTNHDSAKKKDG